MLAISYTAQVLRVMERWTDTDSPEGSASIITVDGNVMDSKYLRGIGISLLATQVPTLYVLEHSTDEAIKVLWPKLCILQPMDHNSLNSYATVHKQDALRQK